MTNRIAVVVFSWNRPDYLIRMLDSLAKNTVIDDCDVYLWNDGWRNDPTYPYATDENEEKVHVLVDQCEEILNTFPFKHKEVIAKQYNVCIGRQLQEAKARLFHGSLIDDAPRGVVADLPTYDNVIFFDDDHVVSKNYIDILLKLHEQYPDAIVGAQASEIRNIPRDAELDEVGVTLKQGGIDDTRPGRWRWLGYLLPKAVYEATLEEMNEYMEFIGPSYRNIPHEAVRVKYGVMVTGFDGVMDKICDQHGIRRIATVVPRAKYIGEKGLFGNPRLYEAMGFAHNLRYEFDEVEKFKVRDGMAEMPKNKIFDYVLDRYCESPVRVLEIGRMRNTAPFSEASDGWSTLQFARNSKVEVLYSVDNDPKTLKVCEQYPELADGKVVFAERVEDLRWDQVDLLYLDAENSANATVGHYESMKGGLIDSAVILIDDVYSPDGNKGNLIIPLLEKEGYMIEKIYPMALARKV